MLGTLVSPNQINLHHEVTFRGQGSFTETIINQSVLGTCLIVYLFHLSYILLSCHCSTIDFSQICVSCQCHLRLSSPDLVPAVRRSHSPSKGRAVSSCTGCISVQYQPFFPHRIFTVAGPRVLISSYKLLVTDSRLLQAL